MLWSLVLPPFSNAHLWTGNWEPSGWAGSWIAPVGGGPQHQGNYREEVLCVSACVHVYVCFSWGVVSEEPTKVLHKTVLFDHLLNSVSTKAIRQLYPGLPALPPCPSPLTLVPAEGPQRVVATRERKMKGLTMSWASHCKFSGLRTIYLADGGSGGWGGFGGSKTA